MATRQFTFTEMEYRLISQWASIADHDLKQAKMLTSPDSPKERAVEADHLAVRRIMDKLAGRESVTPLSHS